MLGVSFGNANMERLSLLFAVLLSSLAQGQNLVPNWSFEEHTACPSNLSQIERATGWMPFRVSPDYYNTCSPSDSTGVPLNYLGYQAAATGDAYAGIWCYFDKTPANAREYMGIQLSEPLTPGTLYHLAFKTVFASSGSPDYYLPQFNCSGIGLRFAVAPFQECGGCPVPNQAAIDLDYLITDTVNWTTVSGTYVPDSAYAYLVVGNFFDDQTILVDQFDPDGNIDGAYFYVDDVCVSHDPGFCTDQAGVNEREPRDPLIFPNPVADELHITLPSVNGSLRMSISDAIGRVVCDGGRNDRSLTHVLDVSYLSAGVYVLRVSDGTSSFAPVRFVHAAH